MNILNHPIMPTLIVILLNLWPVMRIYKRVGLNPLWGLMLFISLLLPLSGFMLVMLPLAIKPWPNFPKRVAATKPLKAPI